MAGDTRKARETSPTSRIKPSSAATRGRSAGRALQGDEDVVAVQGQGLARRLPEQPQFGPAGAGDLRGEDPPV